MKLAKGELAKFTGKIMPWLSIICNKAMDTVEDFYQCFESRVYKKEEMLLETLSFNFSNPKFEKLDIEWSSVVTTLWHGRCLQTEYQGLLEEGSAIKFHLNTSIDAGYTIYLHDPDFHLISLNPMSIPSVQINLNIHNAEIGAQQYIHAEKYKILGDKHSPCTDYETEDSSFTDCVHSYVRNISGCKVDFKIISSDNVKDFSSNGKRMKT